MDTDEIFVEDVARRFARRDAAIPLLQAVQARFGYLPAATLEAICQRTPLTPAQLVGVATFYPQFRFRPVGRHLIRVCDGTACHVKGSELVRDALFRELKIAGDGDTDPTGTFTVEKVACLGCCTLAPVIQIDEVTYGHLTPGTVAEVVQEFLRGRQSRPRMEGGLSAGSPDPRGEIRIGLGSCCVAKGSARVFEAVERAVAGLGGGIAVKRVGCVCMCSQAPLLEVLPAQGASALYARVLPEDVSMILGRHFRPRGPARRVERTAARWLERVLAGPAPESDTGRELGQSDPQAVRFFGPQRHLATELSGTLDPEDLDEYIRHGGFEALRRCLGELTPEQVIAQIRQSGLRGRGGAGFPTGVKWEKVRAAAGAPRTVVCNGDEGDPGAFMDRMLMESYPFRVLEGMAIAARAVGAVEGVLYIRSEYPLALQRIRGALARCEERGLLGPDVMGSGGGLALRVFEGAGAFVCGEETALIASVEGRRGMPRLRPPYPDQRGIGGGPTLVNNVETYALVPWIVRHGAEVFAAMGTEGSKGTKVFALAGKVARGGLIEVPMGVTIRAIVEDIGGGMADRRTFKAVQIGGPSGGCIPARLADTPVDYQALSALGAIMGSGGIVVLDERDCMVELARYFLEFTQGQSCGRCTFCRIGTRRMLDVLERLCRGEGRIEELGELEELAHKVQVGSLCGLGKTAPNPVLTTLKYFRDEYEAHAAGRCPAGRCRALIRYTVTEKCIGCTLCAQHCPVGAIALKPYERHEIDQEKCIRCGTCQSVCPEEAVEVK